MSYKTHGIYVIGSHDFSENMILYDVKKDLKMNFMKNMRFILKLEIELSMLKR